MNVRADGPGRDGALMQSPSISQLTSTDHRDSDKALGRCIFQPACTTSPSI